MYLLVCDRRNSVRDRAAPFRAENHVRKRAFNELKRETLALFEASPEGLQPQAYAWQIGKLPARAAYSYLKRLWRWGLLVRRERPVRYRISQRGRDRLAWLQNIRT